MLSATTVTFGQHVFNISSSILLNFFSFSWENKDHGQWEYYTLECLLYFLKNVHLSHPAYVKEAAVSSNLLRLLTPVTICHKQAA